MSDLPSNSQEAKGLDHSAPDSEKPLTRLEITALPRRTVAVTAAGITLILVGLLAGLRPFMPYAWAPKAIALINYIVGAPLDTFFFAYARFVPIAPEYRFFLVPVALTFAGIATILRWRGWRIMAGTVSWFMIFVALRYWNFRGLRLSDAIVPLVMVPVFLSVLWAKRRERKPSLQTPPTAAVIAPRRKSFQTIVAWTLGIGIPLIVIFLLVAHWRSMNQPARGGSGSSRCSDPEILTEVYNQFWGPEAIFHEKPAEKDVDQEKSGMLESIMGRIDCSVRVRGDRSLLRIYYHLTPRGEGRYEVTVDRSASG